MKFCKALDQQVQDLPEYLRVFINYKRLKKIVKQTTGSGGGPSTASHAMDSRQERALLDALKVDVEKLNNFFIGQEEEAVIKIEALAEAVRRLQAGRGVVSKQKLQQVKKQLVDFHGRMVMLDHWSSLNYSGVAKILKKHDKHTKGSLKGGYLQLLKKQPFIQTDRINSFAHRADELAQQATALLASVASSPAATRADEPEMAKLILCALNSWKHLASSASTPSTIMPVAPPAAAAAAAGPAGVEAAHAAPAQSQGALSTADDTAAAAAAAAAAPGMANAGKRASDRRTSGAAGGRSLGPADAGVTKPQKARRRRSGGGN